MVKPAKNTICLWYDGDAEEAARFYAKTFPDSSVGAVHRAPGDFPSGKKGDVLTVEFTVMGVPCLGLNGGPAFKHSEAFSFQVATAQAKRIVTERDVGTARRERGRLVQGQWGCLAVKPCLTKAITVPLRCGQARVRSMMQMKRIEIEAMSGRRGEVASSTRASRSTTGTDGRSRPARRSPVPRPPSATQQLIPRRGVRAARGYSRRVTLRSRLSVCVRLRGAVVLWVRSHLSWNYRVYDERSTPPVADPNTN